MTKKTSRSPFLLILATIVVIILLLGGYIVNKRQSDQEIRDRYMQQLFEFQQNRGKQTPSP